MARRSGQWFRSHGNEMWLFDADGLMAERHASIDDHPIGEVGRLFRRPQGPRPQGRPGLSEIGAVGRLLQTIRVLSSAVDVTACNVPRGSEHKA